jgi:anti-anti-sigma regulatory factor
MHLVIHQDSPVLVRLELHGNVDHEDIEIFKHECFQLLQHGWHHFCVDFTPCTRLDESLFEIFRPLQQQGAIWQFIAPQPRVFNWLQQLRFPVVLQQLNQNSQKAHVDLFMPF